MQSVVNQDWRGALIRHLLLVLAASLVLGVVSGHYGWALALGLALYLGWTLWQLLRLHQWLRNHQPDEPPPDSYGLWGEVFDNIYHLQRRNQRARGRLQAVIDRIQESTAALRDAVIMLDSDGNLEWWNLVAENLLGLKTPQDGGQPVSNLIRHPRFKEYFDQEDYREPLEIPSPINERLRLQFHITLYGNREHLMLVRDVTRVHQLEQMRKDFVANVSHELRTPLTVIAGYLETLLDNVEDVNPRWLRALQQMQQQAGRMQNLLNDLLLLAKLDASEWKDKVRTRIRRSDGVIALISKNSLASSGQKWEIACAREEGKKVLGIWAYSDDRTKIEGVNTVVWTWDAIKNFINGL